MDDLEKVHAKEEIKKWKRSLSEKDWQEYKKKAKLGRCEVANAKATLPIGTHKM